MTATYCPMPTAHCMICHAHTSPVTGYTPHGAYCPNGVTTPLAWGVESPEVDHVAYRAYWAEKGSRA